MRVLLASAAYLTVAVGGVSLLAAGAHTLATAASPLLVLPPAKFSPAPSLVERRLIAQEAPEPESQPLRRVVALKAPEIPLAVLVRGLDEAETAYEPPQAVNMVEVLVVSVVQASGVDTVEDSAPPLLQVAALDIDGAQLGQPVPALTSKQKAKQIRSSSKRKTKPALVAKLRETMRWASLETPGQLMNRAFLQRQS